MNSSRYFKACLIWGEMVPILGKDRRFWIEITDIVFVSPPGHGQARFIQRFVTCRTLRPTVTVQGQTAQASMLQGHNIQMFYARSDYGVGKGKTESGIKIPKDLGIGAVVW